MIISCCHLRLVRTGTRYLRALLGHVCWSETPRSWGARLHLRGIWVPHKRAIELQQTKCCKELGKFANLQRLFFPDGSFGRGAASNSSGLGRKNIFFFGLSVGFIWTARRKDRCWSHALRPIDTLFFLLSVSYWILDRRYPNRYLITNHFGISNIIWKCRQTPAEDE